MRTIVFIVIEVVSFTVCATQRLSAEMLKCEFWSTGDIPKIFDSEEFRDARRQFLRGTTEVEKGDTAFATLATLKLAAAAQAKLPSGQSKWGRVSVFRRMATGEVLLIIDGRDAVSVALGDVYETDIMVFHEFMIR